MDINFQLEEKIRQTFIRKPRKIVEEKEIISKQIDY